MQWIGLLEIIKKNIKKEDIKSSFYIDKIQ